MKYVRKSQSVSQDEVMNGSNLKVWPSTASERKGKVNKVKTSAIFSVSSQTFKMMIYVS